MSSFILDYLKNILIFSQFFFFVHAISMEYHEVKPRFLFLYFIL